MEFLKIFSSTERAIKAQLSDLDKKLAENSRELGKLGHDGDMIDDPFMFQLHEERNQLLKQKGELGSSLSCGVVTSETLNRQDTVSLGHRVKVDVTYPNNETEIIDITLGSKFDQKYHNKDEDEQIVSNDSPLGKALFGKKIGDEAEYEGGDGKKGKIKVLGILTSRFTK
ncbi:MAG: hypothetical protein ACD_13C00296G0007 [uncultured bacterium]|uniref:Transcription elongation factor n=1 Tax=Candidatus Woesebacteria bacterium GW2011_GWA1_40_43 TaxID=1618553 RepID=A0A0G0VLR0_9BACT|nr:MAG: hypothetical protein ACD_13C00296G0007 [uncultured bacterium]KKR52064.1 MAG: Transcription elongation factor [Candidatus Woesebacteria bacterium GW2011_GWD2_40_19]KKR57853.1 MAG: Transcription elongation factor [Candidatus Woesebacteria bacterium GW2011_GWC2_40_30]KKR63722.1 MAG: Transcription elongation factor [Candidatus Woesebacteria bacterium GW2011_GWA1_40_43]HAU65477.1 hypothetical protein [Candidatus Woesebacteria bacterium]